MPRYYFLADSHLSPAQPGIHAAFRRALAHIAAQQPDGVYILGDLFNAWLGDDVADDFALAVADALAALPCPVYFQHGNRDFLLGKAFAQRAHLQLLPERHVLTIHGTRVLLEHGDLLCIHDHAYLRLRCILRARPLQALYHLLPLALKNTIARTLRQQSQSRGQRKPAQQTDADPLEAARVLARYQAQILIHGHTHRPATHRENGYSRYVLGDWDDNGGVIVEYGDGQWRQYRLP